MRLYSFSACQFTGSMIMRNKIKIWWRQDKNMDYIEHYKQDALQFDYWGENQFSAFEKRRNQTVYELCELQEGEKVLDVGSGRGWFSLWAIEKGAEVTAMDLSEANLAKIKTLNPAIKTVYGDACAPLETEDKFDWIVALEVLEHIVEPALALKNWSRMLAPTGKLLLTVPYKEEIRYTLCIHCNQKTPINAHLHSFNQDKIVKLLNHNGFWVKEQRKFGHKAMAQFRITELLKRFPYGVWKGADSFCRVFGDKYSYLAIKAVVKE